MLSIQKLTKSYGSRTLWTDLNLEVEPGRLVALVGPSGSGKSTLLNCVGALDQPTSGSIVWDGTDIVRAGHRGRRLLRKKALGYLFQNYALVEHATIRQNLNYAAHGPWPWRHDDFAEELEAVGLGGRGGDPIYHLSGGEQQRVALARILAKKPPLVLADEPTGALDSENAQMVVDTLRSMANDGAIVIIATHNDAVRDACDESLDLAHPASVLIPSS